MQYRNKTSQFACRFLNDEYFGIIHEKFVEAFADYVRPFQLSEKQFRNHLLINAVDLNSSVGCFDGEQLVGVSLNGFGEWHGRKTVYDAGTGVIPSHRRRGLSKAMFEMMLPIFKAHGAEQMLLEVVNVNDPAVDLYKKLGFEIQRELLLLESCEPLRKGSVGSPDIEIYEIPSLDNGHVRKFWDGEPSWQNSPEAIDRSQKTKKMLGAFVRGKCVGYIVYSAGVGRVAQFAVDREFRGRGVGTELLLTMQTDTTGNNLQVINVDSKLDGWVEFLQNRGFSITLRQFEMIKPL